MNSKIAEISRLQFHDMRTKKESSGFVYWVRHSEFFRYLAVSLIAFVLDVAVFSAGIRLIELSWAMAATLGFVVGVLAAYTLSVRFVFYSRKLRQAPLAEMLTFSLVGLCGLTVTQVILWVGIERWLFNPETSKFCAAGVTLLFNFFVRKFVLFNATSATSLHLDDHHDIR